MTSAEAASFAPSAILAMVLIAGEVRRRPFSLHLMHLGFVASFLVCIPAAQRAFGVVPFSDAIPFAMTSSAVLYANGVVLAWLLAYACGYYWGGGRVEMARRQGAPGRAWSVPLGSAGMWVSCIIASASALAYLFALGTRGIVTRGAMEALAFGSTQQFLLITIFIKMVPVAGAMVVLLFLAERQWRGWLAVGLLACLVYAVYVLANPFAAARFQTASVLIGVAAIVTRRRLRTGLAAVGALLFGLFIGLPYLNLGRNAERREFGDLPSSFGLGAAIASGDFDAYAMLLATAEYVERVGITWGRQLIGVVLFWFPRKWWEGKPVGSGRVVAEYLGLPNVNVSSPLPAEALINGGLLCIPVAALLFGLLLRRLDDLYWLRPVDDHVRRIDLAYPLWLGMVFFLSRGDLLSGFAFTVGTSAAAVVVTLPLGTEGIRRVIGTLRGTA